MRDLKGGAASRSAGRSATAVAIAILVVAPLLFYAGMILGGKEPPAPDTIAARPLGEWARQATRELGATPEWIPHLFSGMPSYGSFVHTPASPLSPMRWLLAPFADARGMRYFLLMVLGGVSAFFFFRRQGAGEAAAATVSLAYVLTPYIPGVIEAGHSTKLAALMHVPLFMLAWDTFLQRPGAWAAALVSGSGAMLIWANHPQIAYYAVMVAVPYGIGVVWMGRRERSGSALLKGAGWLIAAGAVAFCLIAEPTLAVREYVRYSIRGAGASGGVDWDYATAWSFHPKELVTFLFPGFYGLKSPVYFGPLPFTQSTHYLGIVFLAAAAVGFAKRRNGRLILWAAISVFLLLVGFGEHFALLYRALYDGLPAFSKFRVPSMIYALLPLTLGALAAAGLEACADPAGRERSGAAGARRLWFAAAIAAAGVATIALLVGTLTRGEGIQSSEWLRPGEAQRHSAERLLSLRGVRWDLRVGSIVQGMLFLGLFLAAVPWVRRFSRRAAVIGLSLLLLVDIGWIGAKFISLEDRQAIEAEFRPTPDLVFLSQQAGLFRVLPIDDFGSNRFVATGVQSVGGYQPAKLKIYQDLLERDLLTQMSVLSMLNVRYLLAEDDPGHPAFAPVSDGVYEYRAALPRAWFVPGWKEMPNDAAVLRTLGESGFDPAKEAIFIAGGTPSTSSSGLSVGDVQVVSHGPHHLDLRVSEGRGSQDRLLIVSEIFYPPGWTAEIDGKLVPILRANHCLRAVVVPPGGERVVFRYASHASALGRSLNRAGGTVWLFMALLGLGGAARARGRSG